jgi:hypothetical protein
MMFDEEDDGEVAYYFKDGEIQFTEEGLRHFTKEERASLADLYEQMKMKFNEICDHIAKPLGVKEALSDETKAAIFEEAEELTERWDFDVVMEMDPAVRNTAMKSLTADEPELQALLKAHHEIAENILDVRDAAMSRARAA